MNEKIKLIGANNRNEVISIIVNCDIVVSASIFESFGIVFVEVIMKIKSVIGIRTRGANTFINKTVVSY